MEQNVINKIPFDERFEFYQLDRTIKIVRYKPGNLFSVSSILVSYQSEKDEEDWLSCLSLESVRDITDNDSSFVEQQIDNGHFQKCFNNEYIDIDWLESIVIETIQNMGDDISFAAIELIYSCIIHKN